MAWIDRYMTRQAWAILKNDLLKSGYYLKRGSDFEILEAKILNSDRSILTEHFRTSINTYTPNEAFWIAVETERGETIARVATRIDRLGELSLLDYWRKYWRRCYPGVVNEQAQLAPNQPNFAKKIKGNVAYVGDLFVEKGHRGKGIASSLVKIVQIDAFDEWYPHLDYLYGWMTPEQVASKLFPNYGFRQVRVHGIHWDDPPATIGGDLTFVGNSAADLSDLLLDTTTFPNV